MKDGSLGPLGVGEARNVLNERLLAWIVALSVIGYPVAGLLAVLLGVDSRATSIPFRLLVVGLSLWTLLTVLQRPQRIRFDLILVVFLWLYLARLVADLGRPEFPNVVTDTLFFVSVLLIPVMAASILTRDWNEATVAWPLFCIGGTVCIAISLMNALGIGGERLVTETQQRLSVDTVNPITFGHAAVTTLFAILILWRRPRNLIITVVLGAGAAFSFWVLWLANSRSPWIALVLSLLAWLVATKRWRILGGLILAGVAFVVTGEFVRRFSGTRVLEGGARSTSERLMLQESAWQDFLSNPLTGTGYLDSRFTFYPHNVLIESGMALGVVGLVLLSLILLLGILRANRAFAFGEILLGCLFVQYMVLAQFSGNIYASGPLFILLTVIGGRYLALSQEKPTGSARKLMPWERR